MIFGIVGPTATHKSELAEFMANLYNADVINFDAYQVYIELNKGTAKPSEEFLRNHPNYHLYNFRSINNPYDVATFQKDGRKLLNLYKDKNIVLVGGTGLYLKALIYDYKFLNEESMPIDFLKDLSNDELYLKLKDIDELDALKIGNHNRKRLLRSLYIYETHKKNKTQLNNNGKDKLLYDIKLIGINPKREILYDNINSRVDKMIENGLLDEINDIKKKFKEPNRALQAIGYKEFFLNLPLNDTIELIKKNTRHYAKRQLTFFKNQFNNVEWYESIIDVIKKYEHD